jgi:L-evernosamine nitrososynthase
MAMQLEPRTEPGRKFVALAETHAVEAAEHASRHDHESTFPFELFESMKASGFLGATVPTEFGGSGLTSCYDLAVGLSRLAHGDGSSAIAANMHFDFGLIGGRVVRSERERGNEREVARLGAFLELLGSGSIGMANITEPGTDILHPLVEATRVDGGWTLNGRKSFGTLSPIAELFYVTARTARSDGEWCNGFAFVLRDSPGQEILENWDALGMRASGSHDIVYENCFVPDGLFTLMGPWGDWTEDHFVIASAGNIGLLGSFLGIAEEAHERVVASARTRKRGPTNRAVAELPATQHQVAESEADLAVCRALIDHVGGVLDQGLLDRAVGELSITELHDLNREFQCAKLVVNRKCIDVVDRALTLSGGAGYLSANPLSRLYRDVRAGPFMQPFSPNEAYEYIGRVALDLTP